MSFSYDDYHDFFEQIKIDDKKPKYFLKINNFDKSHVLKNTANQCLSNLPQKEERILRMLSGFGLYNQYDCKEIAKQFKISEVEVIQIANQGFYKFTMNYFSSIKELRTH
tara:strand:+ start:527 stop:856 length:330 start_codon:yes stop_codon:yes gene_type:complete